MKSYNIYIVSSPLQLLNAIEAVNHFKTQNNILIISHIEDRVSLSQIKKLLIYVSWDEIQYISLAKTKIEKLFFVKKINKILSVWKEQVISKVFVGEYRSHHVNHICNYFKSKEIYLLDDGLALLSYHSRRENVELKDKAIKMIYQFVCLYKLSTINHIFFTMFELKKGKVIKNNYIFFKKYINNKKTKELVYFIGQGSLETALKNQDDYKSALIKILKFYKNKKFIYVLHRRQKDDFIKKLSLELNFEYQRFENLIELEMIFSSQTASDFGTFFSTAIMTLPKFLENSKYTAFKLDASKFKNQTVARKKIIEDCYTEFLENNIKIEIL